MCECVCLCVKALFENIRGTKSEECGCVFVCMCACGGVRACGVCVRVWVSTGRLRRVVQGTAGAVRGKYHHRRNHHR